MASLVTGLSVPSIHMHASVSAIYSTDEVLMVILTFKEKLFCPSNSALEEVEGELSCGILGEAWTLD